MRSPRPIVRVVVAAILCGLPLLLLAALVEPAAFSALVVRAPVVERASAAELGIGEIEMGRDFGRPTVAPERGAVATVLLYGVLLLCPAKFVMLWMLQRRESRDTRTSAGVPTVGGA